ncbi:uncharacterized protein AAEQ78_023910 [Lycaon pictus]
MLVRERAARPARRAHEVFDRIVSPSGAWPSAGCLPGGCGGVSPCSKRPSICWEREMTSTQHQTRRRLNGRHRRLWGLIAARVRTRNRFPVIWIRKARKCSSALVPMLLLLRLCDSLLLRTTFLSSLLLLAVSSACFPRQATRAAHSLHPFLLTLSLACALCIV